MATLKFETAYGETILRDAMFDMDGTTLEEGIEIKIEGELVNEVIGYSTSRFDEEDSDIIDKVEKFVAKHCDTLRLRL